MISTRVTLLDQLRNTADQSAWRAFDARYGDLILRFGRRVGLSLIEAEDVRQMVLLGMARTLPGFEYRPERGRFRDYLSRAVRHAAYRYRARHRSAETLLDPVGLDAAAGSAEGDAGGADDHRAWLEEWTDWHCRRALTEAAQSLDPQSVTVFERLLAGEDAAAVAASMGLSHEAARKIKQRVKQRLREIIARQVREEDDGG